MKCRYWACGCRLTAERLRESGVKEEVWGPGTTRLSIRVQVC